MLNYGCIGIFDYTTEEVAIMKKDKFLTAMLMTSCLLSVSLMTMAPAQAAYTMDQEAEISLWTDYIKDYGNDAFGYLNRANINYSAGEYAKAIADYDAALKIDQYNTEAYIRRANSKYTTNDLEGALKDYAIALEINPSLPDARFNIGRIYYRSQNYPKAVENMRAAVKLNNQRPEYFFELARAEYKSGLYADSQDNFSKAIALKDNFYDAIYGKGLASMNLSRYDDAVNCFEQVIASGQRYENASYYKGLAEYQLGKYDSAVADFNAALKEAPQDGQIYNSRGKAQELLGNKSAAKKDYKMAKELGVTNVGLADNATKSPEKVTQSKTKAKEQVQEQAPQLTYADVEPKEITPAEKAILDEEINRRLAEQKIAEGNVYGAVALYDNVVNVDPTNAANYLSRAELKLKVEDYDGALRDADTAIKMGCDKGLAYYYEGQAYEGRKNNALAYRAYSLALREAPEEPLYRFHFGTAAYEVGRYAEADEILTLLLDKNAAEYPEAYLTRAKTRYQMTEYYSAIADSENYLKAKPKTAEPYYYSAMSKMALKNYEDAVKDFDLAIRYDKEKNTDYHFYRAKANLALENYSKASRDYKKIVAMKKDDATTADHLRVAQSEVMRDNDSEAMLYYDIILEKDPYNSDVYLDRARLFAKMGKLTDAIRDYDTVLRLNPNQTVVYKERGVYFVDTKSYRKAILDLDVALKLEPNNGKLYYYRALAKQARGDNDGAAQDFNMAKRYNAL